MVIGHWLLGKSPIPSFDGSRRTELVIGHWSLGKRKEFLLPITYYLLPDKCYLIMPTYLTATECKAAIKSVWRIRAPVCKYSIAVKAAQCASQSEPAQQSSIT